MQLTANDVCEFQKEIQENLKPENLADQIIEEILQEIKNSPEISSYFIEAERITCNLRNILEQRGFKLELSIIDVLDSTMIGITQKGGYKITWNN